jgi:hypothetical protein
MLNPRIKIKIKTREYTVSKTGTVSGSSVRNAWVSCILDQPTMDEVQNSLILSVMHRRHNPIESIHAKGVGVYIFASRKAYFVRSSDGDNPFRDYVVCSCFLKVYIAQNFITTDFYLQSKLQEFLHK